MKCDFYKTDETHKTGRTIYRCARTGCFRYGLETKAGDAPNSACRAWPRLDELGYWAELIIKIFGLDKNRWGWLKWKLKLQEPGPCQSCSEYEEWLNSLPGKIVTRWRATKQWLLSTLCILHYGHHFYVCSKDGCHCVNCGKSKR